MREIKGMTGAELEQFMVSLGEPPYRGRQIASWLYKRGATDFAGMTDLPKALRERMPREARVMNLELAEEEATRNNDARKYLFRLEDGEMVETVLLASGKSRSLCLSSQAGCPVGCPFCATGRIGLKRNLTAAEIVDQYLKAQARLAAGEQITTIVFMGMGEPLLNLDNVVRAITLLTSAEGPALSPRRITVSTCGIVPAIYELVATGLKPELAISVIAADEAKRAALFPRAKQYSVKKIMEAALFYARSIKRPVTFEYILLKGINDSRSDAQLLGRLVRSIPCKINAILYNAAGDPRFQPPDERSAGQFLAWIKPYCMAATLRRSKGGEIDAACGQLRARYLEHTPPDGARSPS